MSVSIATQAKFDSKCDSAGIYAPASNDCCINGILLSQYSANPTRAMRSDELIERGETFTNSIM
jgi:hypothetical protein